MALQSKEESSVKHLNDLKENFLTCSICFEEFDDGSHHPRVLPCLHCICFICLEQIVFGNSVKCPTCRRKFIAPMNGIGRFRKDKTRLDLMEFVQNRKKTEKIQCEVCKVDDKSATHGCVQCQIYMCTDCHDQHVNLSMFKSHDIKTLTNKHDDLRKRRGLCEVEGHENEPFKLFCADCCEAVCTLCVTGEHKGHTFDNMQKIAEEKHAILSENEKLYLANSEIMESDITSFTQEVSRVSEMKKTVVEKIEEEFNKHIAVLEKRKLSIKTEVEVKEKAVLMDLQEKLDWKRKMKTFMFDKSKSIEHLLKISTLKPWKLFQNTPTYEIVIEPKQPEKPIDKEWFLFSSTRLAFGLQEFSDHINETGKFFTTKAVSAYTEVEIPDKIAEKETFEILITLNNSNRQIVKETDLEVSVNLSHYEEMSKISAHGTLKCTRLDNGRYKASIVLGVCGQYFLHILLGGVPFIKPKEVHVTAKHSCTDGDKSPDVLKDKFARKRTNLNRKPSTDIEKGLDAVDTSVPEKIQMASKSVKEDNISIMRSLNTCGNPALPEQENKSENFTRKKTKKRSHRTTGDYLDHLEFAKEFEQLSKLPAKLHQKMEADLLTSVSPAKRQKKARCLQVDEANVVENSTTQISPKPAGKKAIVGCTNLDDSLNRSSKRLKKGKRSLKNE